MVLRPCGARFRPAFLHGLLGKPLIDVSRFLSKTPFWFRGSLNKGGVERVDHRFDHFVIGIEGCVEGENASTFKIALSRKIPSRVA